MRIAIFLKQIPVFTDVSMDSVTHCLICKNVKMTVNLANLHAVTAAILIHQQCWRTKHRFFYGPS